MNANGFAGMIPIGRLPRDCPDGRRARRLARSAGTAASIMTRPCPSPSSRSTPTRSSRSSTNSRFPTGSSRISRPTRTARRSADRLANDRGLKVGDPLPLKGDIYPVDMDLTVRAIYDGPTNREPADVPLPLRVPGRGAEEGDHELQLRRLAGHQRLPDLGQRRHDLHQVQECRHHALAEQEDRRSLSQQRLPHPHPDRGSLRQDVLGHAGRPAERHLRHRRGGRGLASLRRRQRHGDGHARADVARWPSSRRSASARAGCCSWS